MRILLAEDDRSQAESIQSWLELDGYQVDWVERGDYALTAIEQHDYDCILLDRACPNWLVKSFNNHPPQTKNVPVIFITARDSIHDRVEGLDLGANDYLVKPFSLEELSARIRAQLRKQTLSQQSILTWGDLQLDTQAKVVLSAGKTIDLTAKEFQILRKLMVHPEHIITRDQLEEALYAWGEEIESNAIEVFIYQLRKKIGSSSIKTIRGSATVWEI